MCAYPAQSTSTLHKAHLFSTSCTYNTQTSLHSTNNDYTAQCLYTQHLVHLAPTQYNPAIHSTPTQHNVCLHSRTYIADLQTCQGGFLFSGHQVSPEMQRFGVHQSSLVIPQGHLPLGDAGANQTAPQRRETSVFV